MKSKINLIIFTPILALAFIAAIPTIFVSISAQGEGGGSGGMPGGEGMTGGGGIGADTMPSDEGVAEDEGIGTDTMPSDEGVADDEGINR